MGEKTMNFQDQVTVVCASAGCNDALDLMWASFVWHHGEYPFYLWGNSPKTKYAKTKPSLYVDGPVVPHGAALDELVAKVQTPWVLCVDDDVEFLAPVVEDMLWFNAFCVSPPKRFEMGECLMPDVGGSVLCAGQDRIDPCCALFYTDQLKQLLNWTSFACFRCTQKKKHYDTGSMLYHVAKAAGYRMETPDWLWERVFHAGAITWGLEAPEGTPDRVIAEERYQAIRERLLQYR